MGGVEALVDIVDHAEAGGAVEVTEWPGILQLMMPASCRARCSGVRDELSAARTAVRTSRSSPPPC